jgi:hypothetical protein
VKSTALGLSRQPLLCSDVPLPYLHRIGSSSFFLLHSFDHLRVQTSHNERFCPAHSTASGLIDAVTASSLQCDSQTGTETIHGLSAAGATMFCLRNFAFLLIFL